MSTFEEYLKIYSNIVMNNSKQMGSDKSVFTKNISEIQADNFNRGYGKLNPLCYEKFMNESYYIEDNDDSNIQSVYPNYDLKEIEKEINEDENLAL